MVCEGVARAGERAWLGVLGVMVEGWGSALVY